MNGANASENRNVFVRRLIVESAPAINSVVEVYLEGRGITLVPPPDLRCLIRHGHAPSRKAFPVMLGLVRDIAGQVIGLHRTLVAPDGAAKAEMEPATMSLSGLKGGAVRLHERDADLTARRFIVEGRRFRIVLPPEIDTDFNDMLRAG